MFSVSMIPRIEVAGALAPALRDSILAGGAFVKRSSTRSMLFSEANFRPPLEFEDDKTPAAYNHTFLMEQARKANQPALISLIESRGGPAARLRL